MYNHQVIDTTSNDEFQPPYTGIVMSIGNEVKNCKVGDRVAFNDFSGSKVLHEIGVELILLKDEDIMMVFE